MRYIASFTMLSACAHSPQALRPSDVVATVAASLHFGSQIAAWQGSEALDRGDVGGCIAGGVGAAIAQSAAHAVAAGPSGSPLLPEIHIDVSACGASTAPIIEDANPSIGAILSLSFESVRTMVEIHGDKLACRDRAWMDGVLRWLATASPAVYAELTLPDGVVSVPAVTVDLNDCGGK